MIQIPPDRMPKHRPRPLLPIGKGPSEEPTVLCIDCRHFTEEKGLPPMCAAPSVRVYDPVRGNAAGPSCSRMRAEDGACKFAGMLFEHVASQVAVPSRANPIPMPSPGRSHPERQSDYKSDTPTAICESAPDSLNKFDLATLRCTTPVADETREVGMAFEKRNGEVIRLRVPIADMAALTADALEYMAAHRSRVHSRQSPGMPSVDISTPDDGMKV